MSDQPWLLRAREALLDLLFPPHCRGCGQGGQWFCDRCVASLKRLGPRLCERCGEAMQNARVCESCRRHPLPNALDGLRAVAEHDGALRRAIHALKYEQVTAVAEPLGNLLADYLEQHPLPVTLVIPVPLHVERLRERGYNQSVLLAEVVSRRSGIPLNTTALIRRRNTLPQVGLNESARRQNLIDAFDCTQRLDGQGVLLIDDVCTTGATMSECALALSIAGAGPIWGLTLAR